MRFDSLSKCGVLGIVAAAPVWLEYYSVYDKATTKVKRMSAASTAATSPQAQDAGESDVLKSTENM